MARLLYPCNSHGWRKPSNATTTNKRLSRGYEFGSSSRKGSKPTSVSLPLVMFLPVELLEIIFEYRCLGSQRVVYSYYCWDSPSLSDTLRNFPYNLATVDPSWNAILLRHRHYWIGLSRVVFNVDSKTPTHIDDAKHSCDISCMSRAHAVNSMLPSSAIPRKIRMMQPKRIGLRISWTSWHPKCVVSKASSSTSTRAHRYHLSL